MKQKLIGLSYKNKKISVRAFRVGFFSEGIGLMFKSRKNARALLFDSKRIKNKGIHSYFVFFPFFAIWLDSERKIVDKKIVNPFTFKVLPSKNFEMLLEIPLNDYYDGVIKFLDGKETFK